jgi:hypothetical protein
MRVLLQVLQSAFEIIFGTIINVYSLSMGMFTNIRTKVMRLQLESRLHRPCGLRLRLNGLFSVFSLPARAAQGRYMLLRIFRCQLNIVVVPAQLENT